MFQVALEENSKIKSGVWVEWPDNPGVRFKIGKAGSIAYKRALDAAIEPYKRKGVNNATLLQQEEAVCKAMAKAILLDWEGIYAGDDPLPYTTENAFKALRFNDALFEFVNEQSKNLSLFDEDAAETAKKLQSSTSGTESTAP